MYELPLEKSSGNFGQNTELWNNHPSTGRFTIVFCLIAVVLGILTIVALTIYYRSSDSLSLTTIKVDTLPSLYVPEIAVPGLTRPSEQSGPSGTSGLVTPLPDPHNVPMPLQPDNECSSCACRTLGQQIREKLDKSVDPCNDFYKFVCNYFRGTNEFKNAQHAVNFFTQLRLIVPYIPDSNQLSWQKAAGMYHACLNFASAYEPELDYVDDSYLWKSYERNVDDYAKFMLLYGAKPPQDKKLAEKLWQYDDILGLYAANTVDDGLFRAIGIGDLGNLTAPFVTSDAWSAYISQYTNGTYTASDYIYYREHPLQVLVQVFNAMPEDSLRYLVAWKFYFALVLYTEPYMFFHDQPASRACYWHVRHVMDLAVLSPFFHWEILPSMVQEAKDIVQEIRDSFVKAMLSSTWLSSDFQEAVVKKMMAMVAYVGSAGRRLEPEFVESVYKPYPDAPLDLEALFPTWIKALGYSTHYMWMDTTTPLYDETWRTPFYTHIFNDFTIPTVFMLRPFMYSYGVNALNYGGLGTMIGHEIMHAFDPHGIKYIEGYQPHDMDDVIRKYTKKALCLRRSHKSVLSVSDQDGTLSDELDSENLADFVGTQMAYEAFNSLASKYRDIHLGGLNMSAQQLFFLNHCVKLCTEKDKQDARYAPERSRCIVPLMNMPAFSSAFGCSSGTPMNPEEKCTFW
ncbi:neprilysin-like isoform X2 [Rhipicephalus microplus]|uniref:neprilysin-like isoform X2 n=1 Tax=Rhipicephalus microplus TaxID=6941 RepID=UPI003F6CED5F